MPPATNNAVVPVDPKQMARTREFEDEDGAARLVLQRRGQRDREPQLLFLGERIRKRLDNKFVVTAIDMTTGEDAWKTEELRLKGKGQEPGFFDAFVFSDMVLVHGLYDVLALDLADGKVRWRYRVPFDFEIRSALLSGDLMILGGATETIALWVDTDSPTGDVVWQTSELGDQYIAPYMRGDRIISVRKFPFSVTVRYRATGRLIGRLELPDLSTFDEHPLVENGPRALPIAHHGKFLVATDGWYYMLIDVERLAVVWKRLIDNNNVTAEPPLRFALSDDYLAVLKQDYDAKGAVHDSHWRPAKSSGEPTPKIPTRPSRPSRC